MDTRPHYQDDHVTLWHGDCLDVLRTLPDASVDAVVTDPPYGISFMGQQWDQPGQYGSKRRIGKPGIHKRSAGGDEYATGDSGAMEAGRYDLSLTAMQSFQAWCEAWSTECLRVLKPGGHMLAFGGSRTWHRLAAAVEDAGFEIRDSIAWLYGSGFPKSLDVSKAIDAAAGAEREVLGSVKRPAFAKGRGHGQDDDGRPVYRGINGGHDGVVEHPVTRPATDEATSWAGWGTALKPSFEPIVVGRKPLAGTVAANVLAHGTGALNIDATRIHTSGSEAKAYTVKRLKPGATLNATGGNWRPDNEDAREYVGETKAGRWPTNVVLDESQAAALDEQTGTLSSGTMRAGTERQARAGGTIYGADQRNFVPADTYGDSGGASRFFPTFRYEAKASSSERPKHGEVQHPTVKPLDLMRWLVRLVTPPDGVVLDPFAGSGTTVEAALLEGFRCIAIERETDYLPLIEQRIRKPLQQSLFGDWDGAA